MTSNFKGKTIKNEIFRFFEKVIKSHVIFLNDSKLLVN